MRHSQLKPGNEGIGARTPKGVAFGSRGCKPADRITPQPPKNPNGVTFTGGGWCAADQRRFWATTRGHGCHPVPPGFELDGRFW